MQHHTTSEKRAEMRGCHRETGTQSRLTRDRGIGEVLRQGKAREGLKTREIRSGEKITRNQGKRQKKRKGTAIEGHTHSELTHTLPSKNERRNQMKMQNCRERERERKRERR